MNACTTIFVFPLSRNGTLCPAVGLDNLGLWYLGVLRAVG